MKPSALLMPCLSSPFSACYVKQDLHISQIIMFFILRLRLCLLIIVLLCTFHWYSSSWSSSYSSSHSSSSSTTSCDSDSTTNCDSLSCHYCCPRYCHVLSEKPIPHDGRLKLVCTAMHPSHVPKIGDAGERRGTGWHASTLQLP